MLVGTVSALTLYPVKSMRGVSVPRAELYWYGLNGDRKYAFLRAGVSSGFPWLTARELPELLQYQPHFVNPDDHYASAIGLTMSGGENLELSSPRLITALTEVAGEPVSLLHLKRGAFDCMPISLVTTSMLNKVEESVGEPFDPRRLRANLTIDTRHAESIPERAWSGHRLNIGDQGAALHVDYPTKRCVMVNLEPESGNTSPQFLKTIVTQFQAEAGVYGSVAGLGEVAVGDSVWLETG